VYIIKRFVSFFTSDCGIYADASLWYRFSYSNRKFHTCLYFSTKRIFQLQLFVREEQHNFVVEQFQSRLNCLRFFFFKAWYVFSQTEVKECALLFKSSLNTNGIAEKIKSYTKKLHILPRNKNALNILFYIKQQLSGKNKIK
jgi:hypothetical protein